MDALDQLAEREGLTVVRGDDSRTRNYTFVVKVKGSWRSSTYRGTASELVEYIESLYGVALHRTRWARGYVDNRTLNLHPKKDQEAEIELLRAMAVRGR